MTEIYLNKKNFPVWVGGWRRPRLCEKCPCVPNCNCQMYCIPSMIHYMPFFVDGIFDFPGGDVNKCSVNGETLSLSLTSFRVWSTSEKCWYDPDNEEAEFFALDELPGKNYRSDVPFSATSIFSNEHYSLRIDASFNNKGEMRWTDKEKYPVCRPSFP